MRKSISSVTSIGLPSIDSVNCLHHLTIVKRSVSVHIKVELPFVDLHVLLISMHLRKPRVNKGIVVFAHSAC